MVVEWCCGCDEGSGTGGWLVVMVLALAGVGVGWGMVGVGWIGGGAVAGLQAASAIIIGSRETVVFRKPLISFVV